MTIKRIALLSVAAAAALTLAGCGGTSDEPAPEANIDTATPIEPANMDSLPLETPTPTPTAEPTNEAQAAPAPEIDPSEQVQEDADATGMTARVSRDEDGDAAQPAE